MGIFDRGIRGNVQSPFNALGAADTIGYANPRLPQAFGGNVQMAIDYLLDGMYPNYKGTVPTKADLPATATQNDYMIVNDDGDGKSAGYVYSVLEGMTSWIKRYDVDYSAEGILADAITKTSYMYPAKYGATDRDNQGNPITGLLAGQRIYGGDQAGQNLTLNANSADSAGHIQLENSLQATTDDQLNLGESGLRFQNAFLSQKLVIGTTSITPGAIVDTGGILDLTTLFVATKTLSSTGNTNLAGFFKLGAGKVTTTTGQLNFDTTNLLTTGTITAATNSVLADITFTTGTITTASTQLSFAGKDLINVGAISPSKVTTPEVDVGSMILANALIKSTGNTLQLQGGAGGAGTNVQLNSPTQITGNTTVNGTFTATSVKATGAVQAGDAAKISTDTTNARFEALTGDLQLIPSGNISAFANIIPNTNNTRDLGTTALKFKNAYLTGLIGDGTNTVSVSTLMSLRDINTGAMPGHSLFYNGTEWLPSAPDSEIVHNTLSGLTDGDAGHTQFAMLAGRSGGQTIQGGTASGQNLTLDSTSNATKGLVLASSILAPTTDQATDLGTSSRQWKDMYSTGIHKGLRFDQYNGPANYPTNSGTSIGRVIFDTSTSQVAVDTGTAWAKVGQQKFLSDISFDGTQTTQTVTVSAQISDARTAIWQLSDNTNSFERVFAKMTFTQTQVTITSSPALPAGSYRLIGFN